jgi:hypothetical protein
MMTKNDDDDERILERWIVELWTTKGSLRAVEKARGEGYPDSVALSLCRIVDQDGTELLTVHGGSSGFSAIAALLVHELEQAEPDLVEPADDEPPRKPPQFRLVRGRQGSS